MTESKTTVVIATRNRVAELGRTLRELEALRPRVPIIVVDNDSGDGTEQYVRAHHPEVRFIPLPRNMAATARNFGVAAATTPYVAFSDDDSWWAADALPRAEALLDAHPELALIAAKTLVGPENRPDPVTELMQHSPLGREADLPGPSVLGFLACSAVVRVAAYLDCGGFHPLLHFGAEEKLLAYDLSARGWKLCYVEEIRAHHHPSPSRMPAARRRRLELRNNLLITWMRRAPATCLDSTRSLLRTVLREPVTALAAVGALRRLPRVMVQRERLPQAVERRVRLLEAEHGRGLS